MYLNQNSFTSGRCTIDVKWVESYETAPEEPDWLKPFEPRSLKPTTLEVYFSLKAQLKEVCFSTGGNYSNLGNFVSWGSFWNWQNSCMFSLCPSPTLFFCLCLFVFFSFWCSTKSNFQLAAPNTKEQPVVTAQHCTSKGLLEWKKPNC